MIVTVLVTGAILRLLMRYRCGYKDSSALMQCSSRGGLDGSSLQSPTQHEELFFPSRAPQAQPGQELSAAGRARDGAEALTGPNAAPPRTR